MYLKQIPQLWKNKSHKSGWKCQATKLKIFISDLLENLKQWWGSHKVRGPQILELDLLFNERKGVNLKISLAQFNR